jgi:hypothetical protein
VAVAERGPDEIWEYFEHTLDAFTVLEVLLRDPAINSSIDSPRWKGLSPKEVGRRLEEMTRELELQVSLSLVASFEGILCEDFERRAAPHPLAARKKWPGLETAVKVWGRSQVGATEPVEKFTKAIRFRHLLAHGRAVLERTVVEFDPVTVRAAALDLQRSIGGFPRLV